MRLTKAPKARLVALLLIGGLLSPLASNGAALAVSPKDLPPKQLYEQARQVAAAYAGGSADSMSVVHAATARFTTTGRNAYQFSVLDTRPGGTLYPVSLDQGGEATDVIKLERDEQQARLRRYGRLDQALHQHLANLRPDESVAVVLWLAERDPRRAPRLDPKNTEVSAEQAQAFMREVDAQRAAYVRTVTEPIVKRLGGMGSKPQPHAYSPAIHVRLTSPQVREVSSWSEITRVYLGQQIDEPELLEAGRLIGSRDLHGGLIQLPNGSFILHRGSGVTIGLVEAKGGKVAQHPNVSVQQDFTHVCPADSEHSTAIAGILASDHGTNTGVAPDAKVVATGSCSGSQLELEERSTFALDQGADVLNLSFGSNTNRVPSAHDRFYDDLVGYRLRQVVKSAGNEDPCSAQPTNSKSSNVTSPGLGYNVLTVGAFDATTATGIDDCSSGANPISKNNDRQKPELAAPGNTIDTTDFNGSFTQLRGATSLAAPMVSGSIALLLQRMPFLNSYPEVLRAVLMATAIHNREGTDPISDFDGAGGISVSEADQAVQRKIKSMWAVSEPQCVFEEQLMGYSWYNAEQRVRIALAWNNDTNDGSVLVFQYRPNNPPQFRWVGVFTGGTWPDHPAVDIDLIVREHATGQVVQSSASFDNNYEAVDFRAPSSGRYDVLIKPKRCTTSLPPVAWSIWMP